MCDHRTLGVWGQVWRLLLTAAITAELAAVLCGGVTLSEFLRRLVGLEDPEPCAHSRIGRVAVIGFAGWLIPHLGWRKMGWAPAGPVVRYWTARSREAPTR